MSSNMTALGSDEAGSSDPVDAGLERRGRGAPAAGARTWRSGRGCPSATRTSLRAELVSDLAHGSMVPSLRGLFVRAPGQRDELDRIHRDELARRLHDGFPEWQCAGLPIERAEATA